MGLRIVIFGDDGRGSRHVNLNGAAVVLGVVVVVAALASVLWLGWKIGELTARL